MPTVNAFIERAAAVICHGSAAEFAALFELPYLLHTDEGVEIIDSAANLAARHATLTAAAHARGVVAMEVALQVEWPLGAALTMVRVETSMRFEGGGRSDPSSEAWLLREVDGRLRACLVINPKSATVLGLPPAAARVPAARPGPGLPLGPADTAVAADIDRFLDAMTRSFNARDVDAQVALMDLPLARFADHATDVITESEALRRQTVAFFAALRDFGDVTLTQTRRFFRLHGASIYIVRVEVVAFLPDGTSFDPYQEVWLLRVADCALRISAFVNPFSPRLMPEPAPIGDAP